MENLHSNFSNKLTIGGDEPGPQLKLDWPLRSKLIKKLNEHSQFVIQTNETDRMKTMNENNQMIATLDSLPVLIEDGKVKTHLDEFPVQ